MENLRAKAREEALEAAKQLEEVQYNLSLLVTNFIKLNRIVHLWTIAKLQQKPPSLCVEQLREELFAHNLLNLVITLAFSLQFCEAATSSVTQHGP